MCVFSDGRQTSHCLVDSIVPYLLCVFPIALSIQSFPILLCVFPIALLIQTFPIFCVCFPLSCRFNRSLFTLCVSHCLVDSIDLSFPILLCVFSVTAGKTCSSSSSSSRSPKIASTPSPPPPPGVGGGGVGHHNHHPHPHPLHPQLHPHHAPSPSVHLEAPKISPTTPQLAAAASYYAAHPLAGPVVRQTSPLLPPGSHAGPMWAAGVSAAGLFPVTHLPPPIVSAAGGGVGLLSEAVDAPLNLVCRPKAKEVKLERSHLLDDFHHHQHHQHQHQHQQHQHHPHPHHHNPHHLGSADSASAAAIAAAAAAAAKVKVEAAVVTPPPAHNHSRRPAIIATTTAASPLTPCSLPVSVAISQPLPSAQSEVSQYLSAMRPFPAYMAGASFLGMPAHLGLPAFPGMPTHPGVGHLNGKLSPSDHDKVHRVGVSKA